MNDTHWEHLFLKHAINKPSPFVNPLTAKPRWLNNPFRPFQRSKSLTNEFFGSKITNHRITNHRIHETGPEAGPETGAGTGPETGPETGLGQELRQSLAQKMGLGQ